VGAEEALAFGLANRVVRAGTALTAAVALADELALLPQTCLRNDRASALQQWGLAERDGINNEFRLGLETISSGETAAGARSFTAGHGRHGEARRGG